MAARTAGRGKALLRGVRLELAAMVRRSRTSAERPSSTDTMLAPVCRCRIRLVMKNLSDERHALAQAVQRGLHLRPRASSS